jgi:hypothetical protein
MLPMKRTPASPSAAGAAAVRHLGQLDLGVEQVDEGP